MPRRYDSTLERPMVHREWRHGGPAATDSISGDDEPSASFFFFFFHSFSALYNKDLKSLSRLSRLDYSCRDIRSGDLGDTGFQQPSESLYFAIEKTLGSGLIAATPALQLQTRDLSDLLHRIWRISAGKHSSERTQHLLCNSPSSLVTNS